MKGIFDRSHVNFDIFISFYCEFFLGGANRSYVRLLLLYHEFEQFGSLHMYTPRKDFGRSGTRARYPRTL